MNAVSSYVPHAGRLGSIVAHTADTVIEALRELATSTGIFSADPRKLAGLRKPCRSIRPARAPAARGSQSCGERRVGLWILSDMWRYITAFQIDWRRLQAQRPRRTTTEATPARSAART